VLLFQAITLIMRSFEDYAVGEIREVGTHRLTRDEIVSFARTWDPQPSISTKRPPGAPSSAGLPPRALTSWR